MPPRGLRTGQDAYAMIRDMKMATVGARPDLVEPGNLVLVDEYQDFSLLETEFIDILADANLMLIVGMMIKLYMPSATLPRST